ncbi:MAG: hypothetical protein U0168_30490 [Nannocystaceae bacterium]
MIDEQRGSVRRARRALAGPGRAWQHAVYRQLKLYNDPRLRAGRMPADQYSQGGSVSGLTVEIHSLTSSAPNSSASISAAQAS